MRRPPISCNKSGGNDRRWERWKSLRHSHYWDGPPLKRKIGELSYFQEGIVNIHTIGIDLSKTTFHVVGLDEKGSVVLRKKFSRKQLLTYTIKLSRTLVGMEACGGSHYLGRALEEQGHEVRLMPAQYVKPFVKTNKNDYLDAEAIAEAVQRPTCGLYRSKVMISWICRLFIASGIAGSRGGPRS